MPFCALPTIGNVANICKEIFLPVRESPVIPRTGHLFRMLQPRGSPLEIPFERIAAQILLHKPLHSRKAADFAMFQAPFPCRSPSPVSPQFPSIRSTTEPKRRLIGRPALAAMDFPQPQNEQISAVCFGLLRQRCQITEALPVAAIPVPLGLGSEHRSAKKGRDRVTGRRGGTPLRSPKNAAGRSKDRAEKVRNISALYR